jgi:hypothetical protein
MVPTYTARKDRRYRYYICRVSRKKGRSACPTKSVPARTIEESVVTQLRATLTVDSARQQLGVSDADWLTLDEGNPENLIRAVVGRVTYDGISGAVSLDLDFKHTWKSTSHYPSSANEALSPALFRYRRSKAVDRLASLAF